MTSYAEEIARLRGAVESAATEMQTLAEGLERRAAESPPNSVGRSVRNEVGRALVALGLRLRQSVEPK